jgi:hypothetical protein
MIYLDEISTSEITRLLAANPDLKTVKLQVVHMFQDGQNFPQPITLHHLEHMKLIGPFEPCAELWNRLEISDQAVINWHVLLSSSNFASSVLPVIARLTSGQRSRVTETLTVSYSNIYGANPT